MDLKPISVVIDEIAEKKLAEIEAEVTSILNIGEDVHSETLYGIQRLLIGTGSAADAQAGFHLLAETEEARLCRDLLF